MDISPVEVLYYQTVSGSCPFKDWLNSLGRAQQVFIDSRLTRVRRGLLGDAKNLGGGIYELRFHQGPGYRIYFGRDGRTLVILLLAGDKKSQSEDIREAHALWQDYLRRAKT